MATVALQAHLRWMSEPLRVAVRLLLGRSHHDDWRRGIWHAFALCVHGHRCCLLGGFGYPQAPRMPDSMGRAHTALAFRPSGVPTRQAELARRVRGQGQRRQTHPERPSAKPWVIASGHNGLHSYLICGSMLKSACSPCQNSVGFTRISREMGILLCPASSSAAK